MILTLIVAILALVAIGWAGFLEFRKRDMARYNHDDTPVPSTRIWWILSGVMVIAFIVSTGFRAIPAGYVGVVTRFGQVEERTLPSGLQIVIPIVETVVQVDTRVQPHEFKDIDAASAEYQSVKASGKLNYHIDPKYAYVVYRQVGLDFANKVIDPALNDFIKEEMPKFSITDILPKRDQIRADTIAAMNANLARYHVIVDDIYLANLSFSAEYEKAIEDKQVAQQQVQTQQQILEQKKIQAQQAVAEAQGVADANVATAKGQAEANRLLTESLTPLLIQWQAIQKLNPQVQVMLVPTSNGFIFDLSKLTQGGVQQTP